MLPIELGFEALISRLSIVPVVSAVKFSVGVMRIRLKPPVAGVLNETAPLRLPLRVGLVPVKTIFNAAGSSISRALFSWSAERVQMTDEWTTEDDGDRRKRVLVAEDETMQMGDDAR